MTRKRGWRKNNWANRPISPEPDEPSSEPWNQDPELSYSDLPCSEQPRLGPYPIYHSPKYHHTNHLYYRHPLTTDPSDELVPVLRNLDHTSSVLSNPNRRYTFLDALRKATGRIEYWWPELRDNGTLKMEWRYEREVVIPIPEKDLGYSWGHGRPERVLVLDLMNLDLERLGLDVEVGVKAELDLGDGGEEGNIAGAKREMGEVEEEEMDFKSEEEEEGKGCARMADVPVYCPPPPPPTSSLPGHSEYGFEEMIRWISQKQGPGVLFDGGLVCGDCDGAVGCAPSQPLEATPSELRTTDAGVRDEWDEGDVDGIL